VDVAYDWPTHPAPQTRPSVNEASSYLLILLI